MKQLIHGRKNAVRCLIHTHSKIMKSVELQSKKVVSGLQGMGEIGEFSPRAQTFSDKINNYQL